MNEDDISYKNRGFIFNVYNKLGPGLLESVYQAALFLELTKSGLQVKSAVPILVYYEDEKLEIGFRINLLVNEKVIIALKSVEA